MSRWLVPARLGPVAAVLLLAVGCVGPLDGRDDNGRTALMRAAEAGDAAEVRRKLRFRPDIDAQVRGHNGLRVFIAFISWMQQLPERKEGWTALSFAVHGGHADVAALLLERSADPNLGDRYQPPLVLAIGRDPVDYDLVRTLLTAGADPGTDEGTGTPLGMAVSKRDTLLVRMLLDAGAGVDGGRQGSPLVLAARMGQTAMVGMLLAAGADPDARDPHVNRTALALALDGGHHDMAALLRAAGASEAGARDRDLALAAREGRADEVRRLLAEGASPNATDERGRYVLSIAIAADEETALVLLEAGGGDPGGAGLLLNVAATAGADSIVRLMLARGERVQPHHVGTAAALGRMSTLELLLADSVDVNAEGGRVLMEAIRGGHLAAVERLLQAGADPNPELRRGEDPLGYAVRIRRPAIARKLFDAGADVHRERRPPLAMSATYDADTVMLGVVLAMGADVNARDAKGETALDAARRLWRPDPVVAWLLRNGARSGSELAAAPPGPMAGR